MALHVEEEVLRLDVTMGNTLTVKIRNTGEDLLEAALDLARRHPTALYRRIQVTAWAELHDLAPVLGLVLNEVDSLDDVDVMRRRRYTELCRKLLDVLLLRLVLSPLPELLQSPYDEAPGTINDAHTIPQRTLTAYNFSSLRSHL